MLKMEFEQEDWMLEGSCAYSETDLFFPVGSRELGAMLSFTLMKIRGHMCLVAVIGFDPECGLVVSGSRRLLGSPLYSAAQFELGDIDGPVLPPLFKE